MLHIEEIKKMWYMDRVFSVLLHEPSMHATKWARETNSTPSSWRNFFTQNFHPKRTFML